MKKTHRRKQKNIVGPRVRQARIRANPSISQEDLSGRLAALGESGMAWDLAADVSGDVLAGNPHADRLGHPGVWHFYTEPDRGLGAAGTYTATCPPSSRSITKPNCQDSSMRASTRG